MASSPRFKIYRDGQYVGCVKFLEDAAALCSRAPIGCEIRDGHDRRHTLWSYERDPQEYTMRIFDSAQAELAQREATSRRIGAGAAS